MTRQDHDSAARQIRTAERKGWITADAAKGYLNLIYVRFLRLSALRQQYEAGQR